MKISVCIPTSRADTIAVTIQSILRQSWPDWELIAVGQGDPQDERTVGIQKAVNALAAEDGRVRYLHMLQRGAARARNAGIATAEGEVIAFTDDDCEAHGEWLTTIADYLARSPDVGLIGGALVKPPKTRRGFAVCPATMPAETVYDPVAMDQTTPAGWEWVSGNVAIRREVLDAVGPFDEYLGPGSPFPAAEDTDFLLRAEALGVKMATTSRSIVHHTYGYRYNRQLLNHLRNYNYANGGLAAKLTLMGDLRGQAWLKGDLRLRLVGGIWPFRPHRFLRGLIGWAIFAQAYARCLREFRVQDNLLKPLN